MIKKYAIFVVKDDSGGVDVYYLGSETYNGTAKLNLHPLSNTLYDTEQAAIDALRSAPMDMAYFILPIWIKQTTRIETAP